MRLFPTCLLVCFLLAAAGCVSFADRGTTYSATATSAIDSEESGGEDVARTRAVFRAERDARDEILRQLAELRLSDGRPMRDLAVTDPTVRKMLDDQVRAAQITDRQFNRDGTVTVTVRLELAPIYEMMSEYPNYAVR